MKCLRKIIIGSGIFLPVLLSVLFVSPSYAVSDYTYTFDFNSLPSWPALCGDNSGLICSDYSYIYVHSSSISCTNKAGVVFSGLVATYNSYVPVCYDSLFRIDSSLFTSSSSIYLTGGKSGTATGSFDVTFSENNPFSDSCPEPEEPEPCPVVPENPYDDKFDNITRAIYVCGAILIMLYFFYCIYRMIIKNSGVNNL